VVPDSAYSGGSLYVIQKTIPPAALVENIFHTNYDEVADMIANLDKYAKPQAMAICEFCGEKWVEPVAPTGRTYTVLNGDSLWIIAARLLKNGARYPEIKKLNGLTSDVITAGQILKIPEK
jgi:nucleoid-associated protein YgaU